MELHFTRLTEDDDRHKRARLHAVGISGPHLSGQSSLPSNHTNGSPPRVRSRRTSLCAPKVRKPWLYTVWSHLLYADSCVLGLFFVCSVCLHLLCHHPATLQQSVCVVLAVFFYRRQRCAGGVPRGVVPRCPFAPCHVFLGAPRVLEKSGGGPPPSTVRACWWSSPRTLRERWRHGSRLSTRGDAAGPAVRPPSEGRVDFTRHCRVGHRKGAAAQRWREEGERLAAVASAAGVPRPRGCVLGALSIPSCAAGLRRAERGPSDSERLGARGIAWHWDLGNAAAACSQCEFGAGAPCKGGAGAAGAGCGRARANGSCEWFRDWSQARGANQRVQRAPGAREPRALVRPVALHSMAVRAAAAGPSLHC